MKISLAGALLAALTAAALPSAAGASRLATPEEAAPILATDGRDAACHTVTISTVDDDWALITAVDSTACPRAGVPALVLFAAGDWEPYASDAELRGFTCSGLGVPLAVGTDLGACVKRAATPVARPRRAARARRPASRRAAPRLRQCGNYDGERWSSELPQGGGIFGVTARGTDCGTARWLATRSLGFRPAGAISWRVRSWSCTSESGGSEGGAYRCRSGSSRVVRWSMGA